MCSRESPEAIRKAGTTVGHARPDRQNVDIEFFIFFATNRDPRTLPGALQLVLSVVPGFPSVVSVRKPVAFKSNIWRICEFTDLRASRQGLVRWLFIYSRGKRLADRCWTPRALLLRPSELTKLIRQGSAPDASIA